MFSLLFSVACAPKKWVNPQVTDPQQVDRDTYECMKENSALAEHMTANRAGVRAGQSIEVDPQLFEACMRARGYAVAPRKKRGDQEVRWIRRPPQSQGPVVELELGAGPAYGLDRSMATDLSPALDGSASVFDLSPSSESLDVELGGAGAAGLVLRQVPHLDLGLWLGVRSTDVYTTVDCGTAEGAYEVVSGQVCDYAYDSWLAPTLAMGARLRAPSAPRLWAGAALGGQLVGPVPTSDEVVTITGPEQTDEEVAVALKLGASGRALVPYARLNLGVDLVHPDPLGVALSCGVELALRGAVISGESGGGERLGGPTCSVTARLSPRRSGG